MLSAAPAAGTVTHETGKLGQVSYDFMAGVVACSAIRGQMQEPLKEYTSWCSSCTLASSVNAQR